MSRCFRMTLLGILFAAIVIAFSSASVLAQAAQFGYLLGIGVANQAKLPDWRPGEAFHR